MQRSDIHLACQNLGPPNQRDSDAVEARQELDLRIGAAFTRMLTLRYSQKLEGVEGKVSFGPCQFPTLGFVVDREIRIRAFEPEAMWALHVEHTVPDQRLAASFAWQRGHVFDRAVAAALFAVCMQRPLARVVTAQKQMRRKWCVVS
jgi:DNA topoisomerase-3